MAATRTPEAALRAALRPDTDTFARRLPGKIIVGVALLAIPAVALGFSLWRGSFIDDSWFAALWLVLLGVGYHLSRRLLLTVLAAAVIVGVVAGAAVPRLSTERTGDAAVLAMLERADGAGTLGTYRDLAVGMIDLSSARPVRFAGLGVDEDTRMEIGSLTKAMTGLVVADAVTRGEIDLDTPIARYLPDLAGSPAGTVTVRELVTHTSGLAEFGPDTLARGFWSAPLGRNFFAVDLDQLLAEARADDLRTRGAYAYSTLGAAIAGQAVAAAAGMSYPDLMRVRLFEPLGMLDTVIEDRATLVDGGWSKSGLPVEPWAMGEYAPGGGAVSTARDLATFAIALLDGTAPGMAALDPTTATSYDGIQIGMFWHVTTSTDGQSVTWHNGQTGGYSSHFVLDRASDRAAIVLSDVSNPAVVDLGDELLASVN